MDISRFMLRLGFVMALISLALFLSGCTSRSTFEPICREEANRLLDADPYYSLGGPGSLFREPRRLELYNLCTNRFVRANTERVGPAINILLGAGTRTFNEHGYGLYPATPVYVVPR